ncbi:mRNA 3'-end-processing protein RNA14 [Sphaceloma murrayae]|uniref:mRNA 3'-end-processing protein RNA14 n=1 Tax=Sphaceloma murrayae TaxID=2082308 RepID=A0A2K1R1Z4_9PEZI|nr:mRNA 3'-end-processing protein RNA14 [Sphaceloma murrayae]
MEGEDAFLASLGGDATNDPIETTQPADGDDDDEEDYDPAAPSAPVDAGSLAVPEQPSRSVSRSSQKQTTIGGFVAEESDEDEQEDAQEQTNTDGALALETANTASPNPGALPQSPPAVPVPSQDISSLPVSGDVSSNAHSQSVANGVGVDEAMAGTDTVIEAPVTAPSNGTASASTPIPAERQDLSSAASLPKSRLPNDVVGQLEDRIAEDAKGDVDAWLGLIAHLKARSKFDEVRKVYGRFFEIFPSAGDQWVNYARMELELDDLPRLEAIFNIALLKVQSIDLWNIYLAHIRRRNDIATDTSGQGRQVVSQAYEFVINQVGQDKDSGSLWQDYISFIKSGPGTPGGTGWQDAQKMDLLRKAYQRAVCVPMSAVTSLWKEYDAFEMGLNKMTGRKFLQEKSPAYVTARSSYTALYNITQHLKRGIVPLLPPHPGHQGEEEFLDQADIWQKWIAWEKEDPLVLKDEDAQALQQRILFVYRQAVMALRFYPRIWFDAAQWCYDQNLEADGDSFLDQGLEANPESCLLAFKKADQVERSTSAEEGQDSQVARGKAVRAPYDGVLDHLYKHIELIQRREQTDLAQIEAKYAAMSPDPRDGTPDPAAQEEDDDVVSNTDKPLTKKARKEVEITERRAESLTQTRLTSRVITFVWIALMRAMRRIQGKGKPDDPIPGMRGIFKEARTRGRLMADIHVATALLEHYAYKDPAAPRIFNLGTRLFPEDENVALEHIKFLISTGDSTNARVIFETTVSKITAKPDNVHKARVLFAFFHDWEAKYGELSQVTKIEKRMAELYPDENLASLFAQRFGTVTVAPASFDPCNVLLVLSPSQVRSKSSVQTVIPSIETTEPVPFIPTGYVQSPKRPLEDSDAELPARKLLRGESPLKGAAGRRQQQRQARELGQQSMPSGPKPLPPAVFQLLSVIPPARQWNQTLFDPIKMVDLIRATDMTKARVSSNGGQYGGYGYGR